MRLVCLLLVIAAAAPPLHQGGANKDEPRPSLRGILPAHYRHLALTEAQIVAIFKVSQKHAPKIQELRSKIAGLDKEAKAAGKPGKKPEPEAEQRRKAERERLLAEVEKFTAARLKELDGLLTEAQRTKLTEMREAARRKKP